MLTLIWLEGIEDMGINKNSDCFWYKKNPLFFDNLYNSHGISNF